MARKRKSDRRRGNAAKELGNDLEKRPTDGTRRPPSPSDWSPPLPSTKTQRGRETPPNKWKCEERIALGNYRPKNGGGAKRNIPRTLKLILLAFRRLFFLIKWKICVIGIKLINRFDSSDFVVAVSRSLLVKLPPSSTMKDEIWKDGELGQPSSLYTVWEEQWANGREKEGEEKRRGKERRGGGRGSRTATTNRTESKNEHCGLFFVNSTLKKLDGEAIGKGFTAHLQWFMGL